MEPILSRKEYSEIRNIPRNDFSLKIIENYSANYYLTPSIPKFINQLNLS